MLETDTAPNRLLESVGKGENTSKQVREVREGKKVQNKRNLMFEYQMLSRSQVNKDRCSYSLNVLIP